MQLSAAQLAEFDEVLPAVVSEKGDSAVYKVNHKTKHVWLRTGENDGNEKEWRHTGGSYESIMKLAGRNSSGEVLGDVPVVADPIEIVDPLGRVDLPADDA